MPATLVVTSASLDAIDVALSTAHESLVEEIGRMRGQVDSLLIGWSPDTESRRAQLGFDTRLGTGVEAMMAALAKIRATLQTVAADAHAAEVRNVAILD